MNSPTHVKPSPVINSSPLIALVAALPDFDVLASIVEKLIVPAEVIEELAIGGHKDPTADRVLAASWREVRPRMPTQFNPLLATLGSGEAAVIQTALDHPLPLVVIDELRGRRAARLAGLTVIGSLGILVELHRARLLDSVSDCIEVMKQKGIHLAPNLIQQTLRAVDEAQA
jgi:predicted nucleic acid-binding protein